MTERQKEYLLQINSLSTNGVIFSPFNKWGFRDVIAFELFWEKVIRHESWLFYVCNSFMYKEFGKKADELSVKALIRSISDHIDDVGLLDEIVEEISNDNLNKMVQKTTKQIIKNAEMFHLQLLDKVDYFKSLFLKTLAKKSKKDFFIDFHTFKEIYHSELETLNEIQEKIFDKKMINFFNGKLIEKIPVRIEENQIDDLWLFIKNGDKSFEYAAWPFDKLELSNFIFVINTSSDPLFCIHNEDIWFWEKGIIGCPQTRRAVKTNNLMVNKILNDNMSLDKEFNFFVNRFIMKMNDKKKVHEILKKIDKEESEKLIKLFDNNDFLSLFEKILNLQMFKFWSDITDESWLIIGRDPKNNPINRLNLILDDFSI